MDVSSIPDQFFSPESVGTLTGSTAMLWLVVNGIRYFIGFYRKWLVLALSLLIVVAIHGASSLELSLLQILVILGNTFLLAFTSVGANESFARGGEEVESIEQGKKQYRWISSWFD